MATSQRPSRREFITRALSAAAGLGLAARTLHAEPAPSPNFIIIFTDDQGYNDVGCFGSPRIKTPHLDRMAEEGAKFTDFYSAAPVCTPSRAALMTGCYPPRVSMGVTPRSGGRTGGVLFPDSECGLHPNEITLAEILKGQGYATGCVGKWHLGHLPPFLPTRNGFDSYFGIPYSNDMVPSPLLRNEETIEEPAEQDSLTERYIEESCRFIREHANGPFFLYLAHNMPHIPLHISERFRGKSAGGLYGDVIECIDWGVGQIIETLKEKGVDNNTLIVFTSDNGPWLCHEDDGGFATPLQAGKGSSFEGAMREPCIMRWPDGIPAGTVCSEVASTIDLLPTFARLAGTTEPQDRIIDGKDILSLMRGEPGAKSPHEAFYYYHGNQLRAVRSGEWKLKFAAPLGDDHIYIRKQMPQGDMPEALYHLPTDPGEQKPLNKSHADVVERLRALADKAREDLGDEKTGVTGKNTRPLGFP